MTGKLNMTEPRNSGVVRLATYNIHGGVGTDGRHDLKRIVKVIKSLNCNIIALQEVLSDNNHDVEPFAFIEKNTGFTAIPGITMRSDTSRFGNALLTNLAVSRVEKHDLSVVGRERRGAIDVSLNHAGKCIRVLATHLGLRPWERRLQVSQLLEIIKKQDNELTVMMGDINEWFLWGRPLRWIHCFFGYSRHIRTFPSRKPIFALDRIWCHPPEAVVSIKAFNSKLAQKASDHLPLTVTLRL